MASGCVALTARIPACRRRDRARLEVFRRARRGRAGPELRGRPAVRDSGWRSYYIAVLLSYKGRPRLARPSIDQVWRTSKHKVAQSISADVITDVAMGEIEEADIEADQVLLTSKHKVAPGISADVTVDVAAGKIEVADTVAGQLLLTSKHKVAHRISIDVGGDAAERFHGPLNDGGSGTTPRLRLVTDCSGFEILSIALLIFGFFLPWCRRQR